MERLIRHLSSQTAQTLRRTNLLSSRSGNQSTTLLAKRFNMSETRENVPDDKPIAYTKSKAFNYKASENFRVTEEELTYPNYTSFVVKASVVIFLVYFGILREPNDVDEMLGRDLFEIMPELEIPMLENEVKRLEAHGVDAEDLKKKVAELKRLAGEGAS